MIKAIFLLTILLGGSYGKNPNQCPAADVVFVLRVSARTSIEEWGREISFLKDLVRMLELSKDGMKVGVVASSEEHLAEIYITYKKNQITLNLHHLHKLGHERPTTDMAVGVHRAHWMLRHKSDRDVPKIAVVFSDDVATTTAQFKNAFKEAKEDGVVLLGVGIGEDAASQMSEDAYFGKKVYTVDDVSSLPRYARQLASIICDEISQF